MNQRARRKSSLPHRSLLCKLCKSSSPANVWPTLLTASMMAVAQRKLPLKFALAYVTRNLGGANDRAVTSLIAKVREMSMTGRL